MTKASGTSRKVVVRETPIELTQLLKFAGLAESGGNAKQAVVNGEVLVNGTPETRKGRKLMAGDRITFGGETVEVSLG